MLKSFLKKVQTKNSHFYIEEEKNLLLLNEQLDSTKIEQVLSKNTSEEAYLIEGVKKGVDQCDLEDNIVEKSVVYFDINLKKSEERSGSILPENVIKELIGLVFVSFRDEKYFNDFGAITITKNGCRVYFFCEPINVEGKKDIFLRGYKKICYQIHKVMEFELDDPHENIGIIPITNFTKKDFFYFDNEENNSKLLSKILEVGETGAVDDVLKYYGNRATCREQLAGWPFWKCLSMIDSKLVLMRLSGTKFVNDEIYTFRKRDDESEFVDVNGKKANAWLDKDGFIGGGSQTWIGWLRHPGLAKTKGEIARWAKENLADILPLEFSEEAKPSNPAFENNYAAYTSKKEKYFSWGTDELDNNFAPIKSTSYIVQVGETGDGKTTFAHNMARKNALNGFKVLFFSLEMTTNEIMDNIARNYAGITISEERKGIPEHKQQAYQRKIEEIMAITNLHTVGLKSEKKVTWATIEKFILDHKYDIAIIDNLDLIEGEKDEEDVKRQRKISKQIMAFIGKHNIPIVLLHHYRKKGNIAGRKTGLRTMDDISGSAKITHDAHYVVHLSRNHKEDATFEEKAELKLYLEKARGYKPCIKTIYFYKGEFLDEFPGIDFDDSKPLKDIPDLEEE